MKLPMVRVDWGDAWSHSGWVENEYACKAEPLSSVGFLLERNKDGVLLAARSTNSPLRRPDYGNMCFIPHGMITKITRIKGHYVYAKDRE